MTFHLHAKPSLNLWEGKVHEEISPARSLPIWTWTPGLLIILPSYNVDGGVWNVHPHCRWPMLQFRAYDTATIFGEGFHALSLYTYWWMQMASNLLQFIRTEPRWCTRKLGGGASCFLTPISYKPHKHRLQIPVCMQPILGDLQWCDAKGIGTSWTCLVESPSLAMCSIDPAIPDMCTGPAYRAVVC